MVNNSVNPTCFQCGSSLIFISQETVQPEGTRYPQINTIYRCSNLVCQEKKDKERADRLKNRAITEEARKKRIEQNQEKRRVGKKVKMD